MRLIFYRVLLWIFKLYLFKQRNTFIETKFFIALRYLVYTLYYK